MRKKVVLGQAWLQDPGVVIAGKTVAYVEIVPCPVNKDDEKPLMFGGQPVHKVCTVREIADGIATGLFDVVDEDFDPTPDPKTLGAGLTTFPPSPVDREARAEAFEKSAAPKDPAVVLEVGGEGDELFPDSEE